MCLFWFVVSIGQLAEQYGRLTVSKAHRQLACTLIAWPASTLFGLVLPKAVTSLTPTQNRHYIARFMTISNSPTAPIQQLSCLLPRAIYQYLHPQLQYHHREHQRPSLDRQSQRLTRIFHRIAPRSHRPLSLQRMQLLDLLGYSPFQHRRYRPTCQTYSCPRCFRPIYQSCPMSRRREVQDARGNSIPREKA
jgi:hypothetical protein